MQSAELGRHPHFTPWQDPESGYTSYLLTERVAPLQKSFYFVNSPVTPDGRWMWFEIAYPPAPYKCLAVVSLDPDRPAIRSFPHASISAETPVVDHTGAVYFVMSETSPDIWRMDVEGRLEWIAALPKEFVRNRLIQRLGTHLTLSPDGRQILFDGKVGNQWYVAVLELATREIRVIKTFTRNQNHAQFSPVDPNLFSIAQDHWRDPLTGDRGDYDLRIWLMSVDGERLEPAEPGAYHSPSQRGNEVSHEWWAEDGTLCWIRYRTGAFAMDVTTRQIRHVWRRPVCHAHCDASRRWWVCDQSPYAWPKPVEILLFDRESDQETRIVSAMPAPPPLPHAYHTHPHPRFVGPGRRIVYTTTVRGQVDVALAGY